MKREDIIRMAADCEFPMAIKHTDKLVSFAALVAAAEREQVLDIVYSYAANLPYNDDFQESIRARGEEV